MYIEPKITNLKWTHVQHGLERLAQYGINARLWNRFRFDDKFAVAVSKMMEEMNQSMAGTRFSARFNRRYTRIELNEILNKKGISSLRSDILQSLKPDDEKTDQLELIGTPWEGEWFVVDPGYYMDEVTARIELNHRGLIPCNTEDAMSYIYAYYSATKRDHRIIVLDSQYERCGKVEFLCLSRTIEGWPGLFLMEERSLRYGSPPLFLGKKGKVNEEAEDSEE